MRRFVIIIAAVVGCILAGCGAHITSTPTTYEGNTKTVEMGNDWLNGEDCMDVAEKLGGPVDVRDRTGTIVAQMQLYKGVAVVNYDQCNAVWGLITIGSPDYDYTFTLDRTEKCPLSVGKFADMDIKEASSGDQFYSPQLGYDDRFHFFQGRLELSTDDSKRYTFTDTPCMSV